MKINSINTKIQSISLKRNNIFFNGQRAKNDKQDSVNFTHKEFRTSSNGFIHNIKQKMLGALAYDPIEQSLHYQKTGKISKDIKIADGFKDAGKSGKKSRNGRSESNREIIVVDRRQDNTLREMIDYTKQNTRGMNEKEKVTFLTSLLNNINGGRPKRVKTGFLPKRSTEVFLGNSIEEDYAVGRHIALLFKVIGDEIGIKNDLIKGTLAGSKHAWNVVHYSNGQKLIQDCTNGLTEDYRSSFAYKQAK